VSHLDYDVLTVLLCGFVLCGVHSVDVALSC
jgi:hypothetical protein